MKQIRQSEGIDRRHSMLDYIEEHKKVSVKELASIFSVSEMTIRRDLHALEDLGIVTTYYGGASLKEDRLMVPSFSKRTDTDNQYKKVIGRKAASFIQNGDTVFIDVSTTVFQLLRYLPDIQLNIITNSMPVIDAVRNNPKVKLFLAPGLYNREMDGMADLSTLSYFSKFLVDKAFIGAIGCSLNYGITSTAEIEGAIKQKMCENAKESFLLVDHTKFHRNGAIFQNHFHDFDYILTDYDVDDRVKKKLDNLILCEG